jgi:nucleoside-diphosphate-sugar epimerase
MRILLTGGSSFTGLWFARALAAGGDTVVAALKRPLGDYSDLRATRVAELGRVAELVEDSPFGSARFLDLARSGTWDMLCQHAARVGNFRAGEFDAAAAVAENTHNLREVLTVLSAGGLGGVVLTGSVFEPDEGAGSMPLRAILPYGLSKGLTWQCYRYWCERLGVTLGKFVIANPYGPYEGPRFCSTLVRSWIEGKVPSVRTPLYVRDNIHVELLAAGYAAFTRGLAARRGLVRFNPSGRIESQSTFAARLAEAMAPRLGVPCPFNCLEQSDFSEPVVRINTDRLDAAALGWSEPDAWDRMARFYSEPVV